MRVKAIDKKEIWENFLSGCKEKTFLISWNWGEFQKKEGNKIWRFGVFSGHQLVAVALVVKIKAKRGVFLFLPHGPVADNGADREQILEVLLRELKRIAKEEAISFLRVASVWERTEPNNRIFRNLGFRPAPIHMHPEATWELDITPSEEELLMNMRKTTRYLIRKAQKDVDIKIVRSQDIKDLEIFNKIYKETASRHQFVPFSFDYLKNQFFSFLPDDQILIFLGQYKKEIVSSAIVIFWQGVGFYHHGASLLKYNKVPVSYLLQWEAIKEAKQRGCKIYNFWGISPGFKGKTDFSELMRQGLMQRRHPWAGLTLFKVGFGGRLKEYVKTQDLVLSTKYYLTYIFEKIRKAKRGL